MPENNRKSQRYILQLGAAFAVTAAVPLSSIVADAATTADKLSALRAAVSSGQLELRAGTSDGASVARRLELAQGFDNRSPENPPPEPAPPADPGQ